MSEIGAIKGTLPHGGRAGAAVGIGGNAGRQRLQRHLAPELRVLVDGDNLYLGFTCFDPDPEGIAVHTLSRDGAFDRDDHIAIALDTFLHGRTGYVFRVNAGGARQDGLISGPDSESSDWDGIWDAVRRTFKK